jgi:hypothetical protein
MPGTPTYINLSDTNPAAPTGFRNTKWQASAPYTEAVEINGQTVNVAVRDVSSYEPNWGGVNSQSGATYTIQQSDQGQLVVLTDAAAVAVLVPNTLTTNFYCGILFLGAAGGSVTPSPSSGTINGAPDIVFRQNGGGILFFNGTNWWAITTPEPYYQTVQQAGVSRVQRDRLNFLYPIEALDDTANDSTDISIPVFGPSGPSHAEGIVPDPGTIAGSTHFLREDSTWAVPTAAPSYAQTQFFGYPPCLTGYGSANVAWNNYIGGNTNNVQLYSFNLPYQIAVKHLIIVVTGTPDATNHYDIGFYPVAAGGGLLANVGPAIYSSAGQLALVFLQGVVTFNPGEYFLAITSTANNGAGHTLQIACIPAGDGSGWFQTTGTPNWSTSATASSSSTLPATIVLPTFTTSDIFILIGGGDSVEPVFALTAY